MGGVGSGGVVNGGVEMVGVNGEMGGWGFG